MVTCSGAVILSSVCGVIPTVMELETAAKTPPELQQDVLMAIFATLEIPDLVRAGSGCSSWHGLRLPVQPGEVQSVPDTMPALYF